jgi:hypothetical protein
MTFADDKSPNRMLSWNYVLHYKGEMEISDFCRFSLWEIKAKQWDQLRGNGWGGRRDF